MKTFLRFCFNTSIGVWLGATAFLLILTAALFTRMPDLAGRVVGLALPVYFETGAVCALIALASIIPLAILSWGGLSPAKRWIPFVLVAAMAGLNYYGGWVVLPKAREARVRVHEIQGKPGGAGGKGASTERSAELVRLRERFQRLHRLSTRLFGVVFFLLVVTVVYTSFVLRI